MENLCSWKNQKRKKVLGKKTRRKEERKGTTLSGKEKKSFVKATCASRAFTLASRFRTKKSLSIQNLTYMMLKTRLPFLYASTSLDTKHQQLPRIVILKLYVDLLSCSSAHFAGFPFLPRVFPLPLATLLVIVTSSSTLHWAIELKKKCLKWVTFPGKSWSVVIDARRSYRPIGLRFQEAR